MTADPRDSGPAAAVDLGRRTRSNAIAGTVVYIGTSLIGLIVVPFMLRGFGTTVYGVLVLAQSITGFAGLASLGADRSFVRIIASRLATGDHRGAREVLSLGLALMACLCVVIVGAAAVLSGPLMSLLGVPEKLVGQASLLTLLSVGSLGIGLVSAPFSGALIAAHRSDQVSFAMLGHSIVRNGLTLAAAAAGQSLGVVGLGWVTAALVHLCVLLALSMRLGMLPASAGREKWRGIFAEVLAYSGRIQLVTVAGMINQSVDRLFIGSMRGADVVATYDVADRAGMSLAFAANPLATPLVSVMTSYLSNSRLPDAQAAYRKATRFFSAAAMGIAGLTWVNASTIMGMWLGGDRTTEAILLRVLVLGYGAAVAFSASDAVGRSLAVPTLAVRISSVYAASNVLLSFLGVLAFGAIGGAAASATCAVVAGHAYAYMVERKVLGLSGWSAIGTMWRAAGVTAVGAGLLAGAVALVVHLVPGGAAAVATRAILSLVMSLLLGLYWVSKERALAPEADSAPTSSQRL